MLTRYCSPSTSNRSPFTRDKHVSKCPQTSSLRLTQSQGNQSNRISKTYLNPFERQLCLENISESFQVRAIVFGKISDSFQVRAIATPVPSSHSFSQQKHAHHHTPFRRVRHMPVEIVSDPSQTDVFQSDPLPFLSPALYFLPSSHTAHFSAKQYELHDTSLWFTLGYSFPPRPLVPGPHLSPCLRRPVPSGLGQSEG